MEMVRPEREISNSAVRCAASTRHLELRSTSSPTCNLWASERLEHKEAVLKLAFADRLTYVRNEGFRTPDLALPF